MAEHRFVRVMNTRPDMPELIGVECPKNSAYKQVLCDQSEQRYITTVCLACGEHVSKDLGPLSWRRWFLPKRAPLATIRRNPLLFLEGWSGQTEFTPYSD